MHRSEAWHRAQAEKGWDELQRVIRDGRALHSAAAALYPYHRSNSEWRNIEVARRPAQPQSKSIASRIYPHLRTEK